MTALVCSRCGESARAFAEHGDKITCAGEEARVITLDEFDRHELALRNAAGKPLDRVVSEGAARIAAHYSKPRYCKCGAELFGAVFDECSTCYREIKGGFSEDES